MARRLLVPAAALILCSPAPAVSEVPPVACEGHGADGEQQCSAKRDVDGDFRQQKRQPPKYEPTALTFVNEAPYEVSIYWRSGKEWVLLLPVLEVGGRISQQSYIGHRFKWTMSGSTRRIGDVVVVVRGVTEYAFQGREAPAPPDDESTKCVDHVDDCEWHFEGGSCEWNKGWMIVNCPRTCWMCHLEDPAARCRRDVLNISEVPTFPSGSIDELFQRIIGGEGGVGAFPEYDPVALSAPPAGPWVVLFRNFLSGEEVSAFLAASGEMHQSTELSTTNMSSSEYGRTFTSDVRTSDTFWCNDEQCETDAAVQEVIDRVARITMAPPENFENIQFLRYTKGQYYREHHDVGMITEKMVAGPRVLTFFVYLSDVEEGGETRFPGVPALPGAQQPMGPEWPSVQRGLVVKPRRGHALLWPSVLSGDPMMKDPLVRHEALPVEAGVKLAANLWIHNYNFREARHWECVRYFG